MSEPGLTYLIDLDSNEAVVFDCTLEEDYTAESDITEFPVESGIAITDNIRTKPETITLEVVQSNTPIWYQLNTSAGVYGLKGFPENITVFNEDLSDPDRAQKFYLRMKQWKDNAHLVSVHTNLITDMMSYNISKDDNFKFRRLLYAIRSLKTQRNKDTGDIVKLSIGLKQIEFAFFMRGDSTPEEEEPTDEGTKPSDEVPPPQSRTDLDKTFDDTHPRAPTFKPR